MISLHCKAIADVLFFLLDTANMKSIEAIIRLEKVGDVRKALAEKGITAMTLFQVTGRGEQKEARLDLAVGSEVVFDLFARAYLTMAIRDNMVDEVTRIISQVARTGLKGDGLILVRPLEKAIRIRTGEDMLTE